MTRASHHSARCKVNLPRPLGRPVAYTDDDCSCRWQFSYVGRPVLWAKVRAALALAFLVASIVGGLGLVAALLFALVVP